MAELTAIDEQLCEEARWDFRHLSALYVNCTLKLARGVQHPGAGRPGSGGPENDFTNRNTTLLTWNLLHLARMLKDLGGIPAHGSQRTLWDAGGRLVHPNREPRT